jgi:hypothetical protein
VGEQRGTYRLDFKNPWIASVWVVEPKGQKILLQALTMGGQTKNFPESTAYFDFAAREGEHWSNSIGTMTIVNRHLTVHAASRSYQDCVEIREVDPNGSQLFWTFAAGVGFVQFGEGKWAFTLDESASELANGPAGGAGQRSAAPTQTLPRVGADKESVWIALAANPAANEPFDPSTLNARFIQSVRAGVTYLYLSPKWNELEVRPKEYRFKDLDYQVAQAAQSGLPIVCNLRIVDTNQRSMPQDLQKRSFKDEHIRERLLALITALLPRLQGLGKYMLIGNEIDGYFKGNPGEVADYEELYLAAAEKIKLLQPDMAVSTTITFDGISTAENLLKPVMDKTDFLSLTYYPLNPDFTVREAETVPQDFARMIVAARAKKVLIQEVGYPSSPLNKSSEEKQAAMCRSVLEELRSHREHFIGAYWFTMSDFPDSVVQDLARYYKLANADRFRAFLGSLGMFDQHGNPKKSWLVFEQEAPLLKR